MRGGWVVSGLGCRGRHFAASRNASPDTSSFFSFWRLQYRFWRQRSEVSILERLSAAHCDEGRVVTTESNERLQLCTFGSRGRDEALACLTPFVGEKAGRPSDERVPQHIDPFAPPFGKEIWQVAWYVHRYMISA